MPINLKKLTSKAIGRKPINPSDIWNQLDRAVGKEYLRPIQERVLAQWYEQRGQADTIFKMNTGTGKTLVGLLVLQSSLNEGNGPAVYLCPETYLITQVVEQATQFGVHCVTFAQGSSEIPAAFTNSEAILVTSCKRLFNGKSVFGVEGVPDRPLQHVGSVLFDDAHACVEQIRLQFSIELNRDHPAFDKLAKLFGPSLNQQQPGTFAEVQASEYNSFMAVPYWAWLDSQAEAIRILSEHRGDRELEFVWPLLKNMLPNCDCVVSGRALQIIPRVAQTNLFPSFANAKRKFYLSATLLDDSQLVKELGVSLVSIKNQIKPNEFEDLGERLILIPTSVDRDLDMGFVTQLLEKATKINRVVLVPTTRDSERWMKVGATAVSANNIATALPPLKSARGAFLALISKYDGIDLPDDACRILVLDSLPRAASLSDRYVQSMLFRSPFMNAKIAQRIEQGLGRATRGKSDYCAILITGSDLAAFLLNKANRKFLSPGTNAQLELGLAIAHEIQDAEKKQAFSAALVGELNRCLRREDEWKDFYRSFIESAAENCGPQQDITTGLDIAAAERRAAEFFWKRRYKDAENEMTQIANKPELTDRERGWFLQIGAAYLYPEDKSRSISMQRKAYELNSFLFVPPDGAKYHRMAEQAKSQASQSLSWFKNFENSNELVMTANAVCDRLAFGIESELFEQSLADVANIIGVASSRPERTLGRGPDCLWGGGDGKYLVIEAKAMVELGRKTIYKSESEQLIHSCEWFNQEYCGKESTPLLIHPATELEHAAVFPTEGRVVTSECLEGFVRSVRHFVAAVLAERESVLSEKQLALQLEAHRLSFDKVFRDAKKVRAKGK